MHPHGTTRSGTQAPTLPASINPLYHATFLDLVRRRAIRRHIFRVFVRRRAPRRQSFRVFVHRRAPRRQSFLVLSIGEHLAGIHFSFCPSASTSPAIISCVCPSASTSPAIISCVCPSANSSPATLFDGAPCAQYIANLMCQNTAIA